ncbi:MAG: hypothetical protein ABEK12_01410 [Candidatus Nanohaloarchaea archaeon]
MERFGRFKNDGRGCRSMASPLEVWMVFHVVAATEEAAAESLQDHVDQLEDEGSVTEFSVEMEEVEAVDNPHPQLEEGYSKVAGFSDLVELVVNYGPTSVDVTAPEHVEMDVGEIRDALNSVAQMMHQFLQSGAGGMMISRPAE